MLPALAKFIADWVAAGRPNYVDHRKFEALGHVTHSCNTFRVSRAGVDPAILANHPGDRSLTVSPTWRKDGIGLTLGFPGIYACGQAIYPIAELRADGSIISLHSWG